MMLLLTCVSSYCAQEDSAKFQASLNDAFPTIQTQMKYFVKTWQDYRLCPEQPLYIQQTANDSVIVADMVKYFPKIKGSLTFPNNPC